MPGSSLDSEIIEALNDVGPTDAYLMGFDEYAGKLFIASTSNVNAALRRFAALKKRSKTDTQRKILDSVETYLSFEEPQPVLDDITSAIFAHLVKEGVNDEHMASLLDCASRAIEASKKRFSAKRIPVAVKVLVLYRLNSVLGILETVKGQTRSAKVKQACDDVRERTSDYASMFNLEGFGKGEFPKVERIFKQEGFNLGRQRFYLRALRKGFDYHESPDELERKALAWIEEELPKFKKVTARLARYYRCKPVPKEVEAKIMGRMKLDPKKLLKTTLDMRKVIQRFVNEDVHGINPKYKTRVIETPQYLTGVIPSGAAQFFDTFTKKPFQVFFQTTDPKRDPARSATELINLLVHEEYGHCVHHSNSVVGFMGKVPPLHLVRSLLGGPITEGLSFNRELEFFEAAKRLETKANLTRAERAYVKLMEKYGGLKLTNLEQEYWTWRWRIVRFLRVVGDVRVNTGSQGLIEFVDWANKHTGVPRASVYWNLFPAHEGGFPGYATSYAVMGQEIRKMEKKIKDEKKRRRFSTYLCSIGFPPRSIYRKMLLEYSRKLK